ncbi:MAG: hypothetical protein GY811_13355 [Myxococcales bacterium]|nr:hypothetical protein [Myxococcales bacterium]
MKRRLSSILPNLILSLSAVTMAFTSACSDNPVGRKCFVGTDAGNSAQSIIASPALECPSRQCLHYPSDTDKELPDGSEFADLCTAECSSNDECDKVPESPCVSGFECAVAVQTGPFCCRKMCICRDYMLIPDGGPVAPAACDPNNPANTCINLPGR